MLYPWLQSSWQRVESLLDQSRLSHALLFTGVEGLGKQQLARQLARVLLCQNPVLWQPCGHCHSCQLNQSDAHPDYHLLQSDSRRISVDRVRELSRHMYNHAQLGGNKVLQLVNADLLTEAAANALLKTLEEPPGESYLILTSSHPARLLPTILSRCLQIKLQPPSEQEAMAWLETQQPVSRPTVSSLRICHGGPLRALEDLNRGSDRQRQQILDQLQRGMQQPAGLNELAQAIAAQEIGGLDLLDYLLTDMARSQLGADHQYCYLPEAHQWIQSLNIDLVELRQLQQGLHSIRSAWQVSPGINLELQILGWLNKLRRCHWWT